MMTCLSEVPLSIVNNKNATEAFLAVKSDQDLMEEIRTGLKMLKKQSRLYKLEELVE